MLREIKLLDHGYIRLIETYGSDERIVEAARMSTDKGFQGWGPMIQCLYCGEHDKEANPVCNASDTETHRMGPSGPAGDEKLLRYLWENKHSTPFEMAGAIIETQAPIFVFREWHRHRTQSYSELSARYTPLPNLNYIPSIERLMQGSDGKNKQAGTIKGAAVMTVESAEQYRAALVKKYQNDQDLYDRFLADGVPKELARIHLPVARYSRMRAGAVLRNWFGFLSLRMPGNAQYEIRVYADALLDLLSDHFPRSCGLFSETQHGT
jgi:thymidylate synthase (FAD)